MGMPVKLSDMLVLVARIEAEATNRSITAQVEHWAMLGRAAETALGHEDLLALKHSGGDLDRVFADATKREEVLTLLDKIAKSSDRAVITESLQVKGKPVYSTDPAFPGMLVRINPDGTRTPGRLKNRKFIPANTARECSETNDHSTG